jgi:hypothetical protein
VPNLSSVIAYSSTEHSYQTDTCTTQLQVASVLRLGSSIYVLQRKQLKLVVQELWGQDIVLALQAMKQFSSPI